MKKLLLLLCLPFSVFCQNTIGLPDVINYSKQSYSAGLQNWDIKQDKNGIIYIANNEGLLSYDGKYWNLYPLPNKTIVRSVELGWDNNIYVGGQDELGYFAPGSDGNLQYHSLLQLIPAKDKSFGDVWDIISYKRGIFFRSANKIFKLSNQSVAVFDAPSEWAYLGACNNQLYAHDYKKGLLRFENNVWFPLSIQSDLPVNDLVTGILPAKNDSVLITTLKNGIFLMSPLGISKLKTSNNALFENERIYGATAINKDWIALATNNNGIYIVDANGNIIQSFSKREGLQNTNVLSIFLDNQSNLWLGLNNGVDFIAYNSAIKRITPLIQEASGYAVLIHKNKLFAGTSNGLFSVPLQQTEDLSFSKGNFVAVNNTKGQIWGLSEINNVLLMGHHEGAFIVEDNAARLISSNPGFWNFTPLSNTFPTAQILAGTYKGLVLFDADNKGFKQLSEIPGFNESSRFIALDKNGSIWISHPYHGVFNVSKNNSGLYTTSSYNSLQGLPSKLNNHVYKIKNEIVVATEKGVYFLNEQKNIFEPSPFYKNLLGNQSVRYLKEDNSGNIWFIHEKTLGVIDYSGTQPAVIYLPELSNKMLSGFEFIYSVNEQNLFLGGEKGFFHVNYNKYKNKLTGLHARIRSVNIIHKTDSLIFGGYFNHVNEQQVQDGDNIVKVGHQWKTIRIEFSSPLFGHQSNLEYSYRLKGFEDNWSEWAKRTEKEYTNLPPGNYKFEVKVRNNLGNESGVVSYTFIILPPWYKTIWAIIIYLLLFASILFGILNWQQKKFQQQQTKYEEEQKRLLYIHELERSKTESELIGLRNEKLEVEINFKNSELASSAMHLVKKGELLTKVKADLNQVMKQLDNPHAIGELKKMIRSLSDDDNMDKEWENFTKHFDKVHSDFVVGLKEKHSSITNNEVKLCAYLRMNLSTKEIAQLMNISVRGVEISRYRLRKKLEITSEINLFNYLISL